MRISDWSSDVCSSDLPEPLRRVERNGKTPDQQLLDGLDVIDREIAQMTRQLAEGDLDLLATRGRYLQIKYQGDEIGRAPVCTPVTTAQLVCRLLLYKHDTLNPVTWT